MTELLNPSFPSINFSCLASGTSSLSHNTWSLFHNCSTVTSSWILLDCSCNWSRTLWHIHLFKSNEHISSMLTISLTFMLEPLPDRGKRIKRLIQIKLDLSKNYSPNHQHLVTTFVSCFLFPLQMTQLYEVQISALKQNWKHGKINWLPIISVGTAMNPVTMNTTQQK